MRGRGSSKTVLKPVEPASTSDSRWMGSRAATRLQQSVPTEAEMMLDTSLICLTKPVYMYLMAMRGPRSLIVDISEKRNINIEARLSSCTFK